MHTKALIACVEALLVIPALASPTGRFTKRQANPIDEFIEKQTPISHDGVLSNIGPDGSGAQGAGPGVVVASPSKSDPDYFYTWTRDAALVFKDLVDNFLAGDTDLESHIQNYVDSQAKLQVVSNPSGDLSSGGLGEPKFHVDLSPYEGEWGRPQNDGPALRATALIAYGNYLVSNDKTDLAKSNIWPLVQNDLSQVSEWWPQSGFDLWEEAQGSSFFTTSSQHRALVEGDAFAKALGQTCETCADQAPQVLCKLQQYWRDGFVVSNPDRGDRSGKDANSILASNHRFDPEAGCDDVNFQPCSARALANHKAVVDSFRETYSINHGIEMGKGVAVGRYSEDVYMGGNPWYLTTLAAAEQLYDALFQWEKVGTLSISDVSLSFFTDLDGSASVGDYEAGSDTYNNLTGAVKAYADSFVAIVQKYTPEDGSMAEQFGRDDGQPRSAADLTWSYSSFLSATARRAGTVPVSWGASNVGDPPSECADSGAKGPFVTPSPVPWS